MQCKLCIFTQQTVYLQVQATLPMPILLLDYCIRTLIDQSIFISIRQKPIHTHRHTSSSLYFIWKDTCIVHSNIHIHACTKHNHNTQPAVRRRNINTLKRCVNTRHWLFYSRLYYTCTVTCFLTNCNSECVLSLADIKEMNEWMNEWMNVKRTTRSCRDP